MVEVCWKDLKEVFQNWKPLKVHVLWYARIYRNLIGPLFFILTQKNTQKKLYYIQDLDIYLKTQRPGVINKKD